MENLSYALLDSLCSKHGEELDSAVRQLKLNEIKLSALKIKQKCLPAGRCPVCTLPIPCVHFPLLPSEAKANPASSPSVAPSPKSDSKSSFSKSLRFLNTQQSHKYDLIIHQPHKPQLSPTKKHLELKRLQVLTSIGKYKQEKLQTKIEAIESFQENQKRIEQSLRTQSEKRKKYFEQQKEKIQAYKSRLRGMILERRPDFKRCTNFDSMFRGDFQENIKFDRALSGYNRLKNDKQQVISRDALKNYQQINPQITNTFI